MRLRAWLTLTLTLRAEAIDTWLTVTLTLGAITINTNDETVSTTVDAFTLCAACSVTLTMATGAFPLH